MMVDPNAWLVRRKIIIWSLIWLALLISTISGHNLWTGRESSLQETIAIAAFTLFGSIVGSYVFGAIWDDKNKRGVPGTVETRTVTTMGATPPAVLAVTPQATPIQVTVENKDPIEVENVAPVKPEGPA